MTDGEFSALLRYCEDTWHRDEPLGEEALLAYAGWLKPVPFESAVIAVDLLSSRGTTRMPLAGEIVRMVVELEMDVPQWADVVRTLVRALQKTPDYIEFPEDGPPEGIRHDERKEFLVKQDPLIQGYVDVVGWAWLSEWSPSDRVGEAQLRTKWEQYVNDEIDARLLTKKIGGPLKRVQRAYREVAEYQALEERRREKLGESEPVPPLKEIEPTKEVEGE